MNKSEKDANKELSDFLENETKKIPYSCPNWDSTRERMRKVYEPSQSFSDRYFRMHPLEQTQYINEEDMPSDVDWTLPKTVIEDAPIRKSGYRLVAGLAFLFGLSLSYCAQNSAPREEKKHEIERSVYSSKEELPAFRQGPKK